MKTKPDFSSISGIDKLIHEPARIAIISLLSVIDEADFQYIMTQTGLTQGNLSSHLSKLENAGYVEIEKSFKGKRPHTVLKLSDSGTKAWEQYLNTLRKFVGSF